MTLINSLTRALLLPWQARPSVSLATRLALWRSRRDLARLDQDALDDIGIDASSARAEARLGFWDVPQSWIKR